MVSLKMPEILLIFTCVMMCPLEEGMVHGMIAMDRSVPLRWHLMMPMLNHEGKVDAATMAPVPKEKALMAEKDQESMQYVDMQAIMNECNETFRTEMEYITSLNDVGSFPDETDKTPKCYVRCILEMSGVAAVDGSFDTARATDVFGGERGGQQMAGVEELAAACAVRTETCKCERSYNFAKCLIESEIMKYGNRV